MIGYCDGQITAFAFSGSGNFAFNWSDDPNMGYTTGALSNVCAGTYFVEFTDIGNSCVDTSSHNRSPDVSCFGAGTAGPGVLSYDWQDDLGNTVAFRRFIKCKCRNIYEYFQMTTLVPIPLHILF